MARKHRPLTKAQIDSLLRYMDRLEEALPDDARFKFYPTAAVAKLIRMKEQRMDS